MGVLAPGTVVAGHRIEAQVGRGGMGVVYRARQLGLDRVVALKVIAPELLEDETVRARFLKEARAAARIEHPNVIPVHDAGEHDGVAYLAMRYVAGHDLRTLVRRDGPLSPARAGAVLVQASAALDAIHAGGLVHRDVKPANVLVDASGHVYVTDFGLVKQALTHGDATRSGHWVGTLDYVAPEQIRGGRIDARADVYALGGVLHFMLTGRVPFEREGDEAKLWAQLREPPPIPSSLRPELPPELDAVVARAMAKDPDARYPSAGDLGRAGQAAARGAPPSEPERMVARGAAAPADAALEPGIAGETPTVTAAPRTAPLPLPRRRRRLLVLGGAIAAVATAVVVAVLVTSGEGAGDPIPTATPAASASPAASATPSSPVRISKTILHVGRRPHGIALAAGDAWVISDNQEKLTRISEQGEVERSQHPRVGLGARAIVADGNRVWVALGDARQVVGLDARTGAITKRFDVPAPPVQLAAGPSGLWIGTHAGTDGTPDIVLRYNRSGTRQLDRYSIAAGVGPLAAGAGGLWIGETRADKLARLDLASGRVSQWAALLEPAEEIHYGDGYVWASLPDSDSVARVVARSGATRTVQAGHTPTGIASARGLVFVAGNTDNTLVVLDAKTMDPVGPSLAMPPNPFAVAADESGVWVTGLADNTVTHVVFR